MGARVKVRHDDGGCLGRGDLGVEGLDDHAGAGACVIIKALYPEITPAQAAAVIMPHLHASTHPGTGTGPSGHHHSSVPGPGAGDSVPPAPGPDERSSGAPVTDRSG